MMQTDLEEWLTSSQGDTPVSLSRLPGSDEAIKMTDTSGQKCLGLSKLSGPAGSLERMLLATSLWASTRCYLTWKAQATPAGATLYRLSPQMPRTGEIAAGCWPTPQAADHKNMDTAGQRMLSSEVKMWPTPTARDYKDNGSSPAELARNSVTLATHAGGSLNPQFVEYLMGYPVGYTDLNN